MASVKYTATLKEIQNSLPLRVTSKFHFIYSYSFVYGAKFGKILQNVMDDKRIMKVQKLTYNG